MVLANLHRSYRMHESDSDSFRLCSLHLFVGKFTFSLLMTDFLLFLLDHVESRYILGLNRRNLIFIPTRLCKLGSLKSSSRITNFSMHSLRGSSAICTTILPSRPSRHLLVQSFFRYCRYKGYISSTLVPIHLHFCCIIYPPNHHGT